MAGTQSQTAKIDLLPNQWGRVEPAVPEVWERLLRVTYKFAAGGPLGHTVEPDFTDQFTDIGYVPRYDASSGRVDYVDVQRVPQGAVPKVKGLLKELGYTVVVKDHREDSPRWVRDNDWKKKVRKALYKAVAAVGDNRCLRVVGGTLDLIADTVAAVARTYPEARIGIGVPTYQLLWRFWGRLRWRLGDEPLGLYTAKQKKPARVSVGLIKQLPRGEKGDFDLLVLPFADRTVFDDALRVVTSGQYRRVLSFTPFRLSGDGNVDRRLMVVAGDVFPQEKETVPVTAVLLGTHGTRPDGKFENALDAKKRLYWHNARRNRRVAEVAKRLMLGTKKAVRSLGIDAPELAGRVVTAKKTGVAVLVETLVHARELSELLPGWAVWKGGDLDVTKPEAGCGVITTEEGAAETVISAGVLIRATGTKWPLPEVDWPWVGDVGHGVLVDFRDEYHPKAAKDARNRVESYQEAGMTLWEANTATNTTENM
jgi:hypothetical protein